MAGRRFLGFLISSLSRKVIGASIFSSGSSTTAVLTSANSIPIPPSATFLTTEQNSASIEASQATSVALLELSNHFDTCLTEIDFEGDLSAQRRMIERRLAVEAEKYINCSLSTNVHAPRGGIQVWHFTKAEAEMVHVAMKLSDTASDNERDPIEEAFYLEKKCYIPASLNGTTKAATLTLATPKYPSASTETKMKKVNKGAFPLLIIAIKGSRSAADWMVNSNGTPRNVGDLFNLSHMSPTRTTQVPDSVKAHSGFLHCAHALLPQITQELQKLIKEYNIRNVLLTGHSAGGAVASLIFTHFLSISYRDYRKINFSLVTFGAPPVTSPDISPVLLSYKSKNKGLILAICNEYDPVPRTDSGYIRSLLDLHRSTYGLPPLPETIEAISDTTRSHSPEESNIQLTGPALMEQSPTGTPSIPTNTTRTIPGHPPYRVTANGEWILPIPVLHPLGRLIVLKDMNADEEAMDLHAYAVRAEEFQKLLFVKAGAHRRGLYLENVEKMRKGWFNSRRGW